MEALGQASRRLLVGAWVFGFGRHSNLIEDFPVKEKTKIQHHTMFTASATCRASVTAASVFLLCFVSFVLLCLERGGNPSLAC